jgi:hypothetical protein
MARAITSPSLLIRNPERRQFAFGLLLNGTDWKSFAPPRASTWMLVGRASTSMVARPTPTSLFAITPLFGMICGCADDEPAGAPIEGEGVASDLLEVATTSRGVDGAGLLNPRAAADAEVGEPRVSAEGWRASR